MPSWPGLRPCTGHSRYVDTRGLRFTPPVYAAAEPDVNPARGISGGCCGASSGPAPPGAVLVRLGVLGPLGPRGPNRRWVPPLSGHQMASAIFATSSSYSV